MLKNKIKNYYTMITKPFILGFLFIVLGTELQAFT